MGLFDFLGDPGAAAALGGFGQGVLRGQAQGAQQHQLQAMDQYRQAQLASLNQNRQQRLTQGQHDAQARLIAPLIKQRYDVAQKSYWDRNPDEAAAMDRIIAAHVQGFAPDPNDLLSIKNLPQTGGDQAPPGGAPPPDSTAPPAAPVETPGLPQGAVPFDYGAPLPDTASISDTGLAGPRSYDTPFGPAPSTQLLPTPGVPSVFSGEPADGLPREPTGGPTAPAGGPGGAGATTGPAAPLKPTDDPNNEAYLGYRPHETEKDRGNRLKRAAAQGNLEVRQYLAPHQATFLDTGAGRNTAQAGLDRTKNAEEQLSFGPKMEHLAAGTENLQATTAATKALTPVKVDQIRQGIDASRQHVVIAAQNAQTDINRLSEATRHNQATEGLQAAALKSQDALRRAQAAHIQNLIGNSKGLKMAPADVQQLKDSMNIITRQQRGKQGETVPAFPQQMQGAQQTVDRIYSKYHMAPLFGGGGGGAAAAPAVAPAAPAAPASFSKQQLAGAVQAINAGKMHDALKLHPELQPLLQEAWRRTKKQPWPG